MTTREQFFEREWKKGLEYQKTPKYKKEQKEREKEEREISKKVEVEYKEVRKFAKEIANSLSEEKKPKGEKLEGFIQGFENYYSLDKLARGFVRENVENRLRKAV